MPDSLRGRCQWPKDEKGAISWYALRLGPSTFGIIDTFNNEEGREAHVKGKIASALMEYADDLLSVPPVIEKVELLAVKEARKP